MSVGFNHVVVFANTGKVSDYQKSYTNNYDKTLKCYLPAGFNTKKNYNVVLSIGINDTYPKQVITVNGDKEQFDLNCYMFNLSEVYRQHKNKQQIGLAKLTLTADNGRVKFQSETFRV